MSNELASYFSNDYAQARERFRAAAAKRGDTTQYIYYHPTEKDEKGEPLTADLAWCGPKDARAILLITSGLHGAEGLSGSAIQLRLLEEATSGSLPPGLAVVHVHALNPYGFLHSRRVNEDNADVNRNFIDWSQSPPADHKLTAKIQSYLQPKKWRWPVVMARVLFLALRHGMKGIQASLQQGQYNFPKGLFYGGGKQAWTNTLLRGIADECAKTAKHIVHIDIHTGLGKYGACEMILPAPGTGDMNERAGEWWGGSLISMTDKASVSAAVSGSANRAFSDEARNTREIITVGMEFGTLPKMKVLKALAFDNWVHAMGKTGAERENARSAMKAAFSPDDPQWQDKVVSQGTDFILRAKNGLEQKLAANPN